LRESGGGGTITSQGKIEYFKKYYGLQIREGTHLSRVREQKLALVKRARTFGTTKGQKFPGTLQIPMENSAPLSFQINTSECRVF